VAAPKPTDPTLVSRLVERRVQRLVIPSCEACRSAHTQVVTRTSYVVYARCADCTHVCSFQKPGLKTNFR
jgi:hypothetical protein